VVFSFQDAGENLDQGYGYMGNKPFHLVPKQIKKYPKKLLPAGSGEENGI
jgi:hypothetical protein